MVGTHEPRSRQLGHHRYIEPFAAPPMSSGSPILPNGMPAFMRRTNSASSATLASGQRAERTTAVMLQVVVDIDVTEAAGLDEPLRTRVTVTLPDPDAVASPAVACFAFPGGGYSRGYFHLDVPDALESETGGGQAAWHAQRGWLFVACDHLCVGESSMPVDAPGVSFEVMSAVNAATVERVTALLASGDLDPGFPPLDGLVRIGIGQSMGGCLLIVQQGQLATFDAIGVLGYGATHTVLAMPPGTPPIHMPYPPRGTKVNLDTAARPGSGSHRRRAAGRRTDRGGSPVHHVGLPHGRRATGTRHRRHGGLPPAPSEPAVPVLGVGDAAAVQRLDAVAGRGGTRSGDDHCAGARRRR